MNTFFFFNDTATTEIYTLSLHDALPICAAGDRLRGMDVRSPRDGCGQRRAGERLPGEEPRRADRPGGAGRRLEEHTLELQSPQYLVSRLLLEKKKATEKHHPTVQSLSSH